MRRPSIVLLSLLPAAAAAACGLVGGDPYEGHPIVGGWAEQARLPCGATGEVAVQPHSGIQEIVFRADGTFSVTWVPFETYRDYWGVFTADAGAGRLALRVTSGNHVPADMDTDGHYEIDAAGRLVLRDMTFGSRGGTDSAHVCGHVLARLSP